MRPGGLRGDAPNDVRPPSLAGGRALRHPEHPRVHKQHHQLGGPPPTEQPSPTFRQWTYETRAPLQALTQANVKPPSPLLAHEQQPLKPTTRLRPKNARKTPISHPQRCRRFQLAHLTGPQRRRRFQPHTDTSEQRRQGFQHKQQIGAQQCHRFHSTSIGLIIPNQVVPAILHLEPHTQKHSSTAP